MAGIPHFLRIGAARKADDGSVHVRLENHETNRWISLAEGLAQDLADRLLRILSRTAPRQLPFLVTVERVSIVKNLQGPARIVFLTEELGLLELQLEGQSAEKLRLLLTEASAIAPTSTAKH